MILILTKLKYWFLSYRLVLLICQNVLLICFIRLLLYYVFIVILTISDLTDLNTGVNSKKAEDIKNSLNVKRRKSGIVRTNVSDR